MKNRPACPVNALPALRYYYVLACLFVLMGACTANRTGSAKGQPVRLAIGAVKELSMATRSDSTWQLTATSDNQEVVDVSRKPSMLGTSGGTNSTATGPAVFLIKGVTAGTARVVFSEKQVGATGDATVKKTYLVTVK